MNTPNQILSMPTGMTLHPVLACLQALFDLSAKTAHGAFPAAARGRLSAGREVTVDEAVHAIQSVYRGRIDVIRGYSARDPKPISLVIARRRKRQTACLWLPGMVWEPSNGPQAHDEWLRESVPVAVIRPIPHETDAKPEPAPKRIQQGRPAPKDPKDEFNRLFK